MAANHSSSEELSVGSNDSSVWPNKTDEWNTQVTPNKGTQVWWTSSKPRLLQDSISIFPSSPSLPAQGQRASSTTVIQATIQKKPDHNSPGLVASGPHQSGFAVHGQDQPGSSPPNLVVSDLDQQRSSLLSHNHLAPSLKGNPPKPRGPWSTGAPPSLNRTNSIWKQTYQAQQKRKQSPKPRSVPTQPEQFCHHYKTHRIQLSNQEEV